MKKGLLILYGIFLAVTNATAQSWLEYYDSTNLFWEKDWNKTILLLNKALPLVEEELSTQHPNYAILLNDLGVSYWKIGDFKQAESHLEKSLRLKKVIFGEKDPDYAATLLNLAGLLQDMNKLSAAENYYLNVLAIYTEGVYKDAYYATTLNNLGSLYENEANYGLAEKQYLSALKLKEESAGKNHPVYAKVLNNLGKLYQKMGRKKEADSMYQQAIAVYESGNLNSIDYANVLSNYGLHEAERGAFGAAEALLKKSGGIIEEQSGKNSKDYASSLNNLGSLYHQMGNKEKAESHFQQALTVYRSILPEHSIELAPALSNLAGYYVSRQQFEQALPLYLQVQSLYATQYGERHPKYAKSLNNLASLYRKTNQYEKAEALYEKVLTIEIATLGDDHPQYAATLQNIALLNIASGNYEKAASLMQQAIIIKESALEPKHPSWAKTYNNLALLHFIQGNREKAAPYFEKALANQFHQIKNVFPALSEGEKEAFYNTLKDDIERFNTFAINSYSEDPTIAGKMYNNQLVTKGLIFDASNKVRNSIYRSNNAALIEAYDQWRLLRDELARAYQLPKEVIYSRSVDVDSLETRVNELEKYLSAQSHGINPQSSWQEFTWQAVQESLSPGEAAIELVRFREFKIEPTPNDPADSTADIHTSLLYGWTERINYAALIITSETKEQPELVLLRNGEDLEKRYFSYYKNAIRYQVKDSVSYKHYFAAISAALPGINTVYFSPDGAYYKINLNTLWEPATATFLLDTLDLRQVTSTRELLYRQDSVIDENSEASKVRNAVLIGAPDFNNSASDLQEPASGPLAKGSSADGISTSRLNDTDSLLTRIIDLPGTKTEINKIDALLQENDWHSETLLNTMALEKKLKNVNSPNVLHIATHGFFKDTPGLGSSSSLKSPLLRSGLLFAGAGKSFGGMLSDPDKEDGILTAYEAMNLKLDQTDLVVLSACETGSGTIKNGEGVYGLQRSFQVAGAKSIIFSMWKVDDDATQKLMIYFYEQWMITGNKRASFIAAQMKLREEYPSPYYWGGFILIGD